MTYASFSKVIVVESYQEFCLALDIPFGCSAKYRTPVEVRMSGRFLLAKNTGRAEVFINMNDDLAVVLLGNEDVASSVSRKRMSARPVRGTGVTDKHTVIWKIIPYTFKLKF